MNTKKLNPMEQHEVSQEHARAVFFNRETVYGASLTAPDKLIKIEGLQHFQEFQKYYIE